MHWISRPNKITQKPPFWHLSWFAEHGATAAAVKKDCVVVGCVIGAIITLSLRSQRVPVNPTLKSK